MSVRKTLIYLFLFICSLNVFSQKHINGLLFSSSSERINDRTSLILFDDSPLKLNNSFRIDFDLSIWDVKQFGYIFRLINESKQEINFAFVNFYGKNKIYLDFHSPITHKSVLIPITLQDIDEKRWLPISITFDLKTDRAEIKWKDKSYLCETIGLKNPSHIKLAFGLYGLNLDVPRMAIRNIRIQESDGDDINVMLNEVAGEIVRDDKARVKGRVTNPNWMANRYFYWQEKAKFDCDSMTKVAYDEIRNRVLVTDQKSISAFSMRYDTKESYSLSQLPSTLNSGQAIYDNNHDLLYIYNLDQKTKDSASMAIVNMKNLSVTLKYGQLGNRLYHHSVFVGNDSSQLYVFGGYGNHKYSNSTYKFNAHKDEWMLTQFIGDEMYPRYFSAVGQSASPNKILIMGGVGNESGKQEHGGRHLYDLFLLNLDTKQRTKVWELKDDMPSGFVPCSNLIMDENKQYFYTLCYPQHKVNSILQLYKFSMADGSYEIVSDSIRINAEQIETTVFLFYSKLMKEFYAVMRENTNEGDAEIRIYSLLSTPVTFKSLMAVQRGSTYLLWWLLPLLILMVLYFVWSKRKAVSKENVLINSDEVQFGDKHKKKEIEKRNAVYVFGDFMVYDKSGKDISYRFSSKLRSLFALILFYSIDDNRISTEMLTAELWPDKDPDSAKNTRGVTINRLRSILADISGITLYHQNSKWYFSFDDNFYCDYIDFRNLLNDLKVKENDEHEIMLNLYDILKRGVLYPGLQENWIDVHKRDHENVIFKIIWNYVIKLNEAKKYSRLIEFADLYFMSDPLNEELLKLAVNALQKTGKKDQAIVLYNKFVTNYKKSMGEEPVLSLML